jgi:hypothetical protein
MTKQIHDADGMLLAVLVQGPWDAGVTFHTLGTMPLQLATMERKAGEHVKAHTHRPELRTIDVTAEVLLIRKGRVSVQIFDNAKRLCADVTLRANDGLLLVAGGHAMTVLEDTQLAEIKQGPFQDDKVPL